MTRRRARALLMLAIIASMGYCVGVFVFFDPTRRPTEVIRAELLQATRLGSSPDMVEQYAESHLPKQEIIHWTFPPDGGRTFQWKYGSYLTWDEFPFATIVNVVWEFDRGGKLIEIHVGKFVDGP